MLVRSAAKADIACFFVSTKLLLKVKYAVKRLHRRARSHPNRGLRTVCANVNPVMHASTNGVMKVTAAAIQGC